MPENRRTPERVEYERLWARERRARMTPEEKAIRAAKDKAYRQSRVLTEEQKERARENQRRYRASLTGERLEQRLAKQRERNKTYVLNEAQRAAVVTRSAEHYEQNAEAIRARHKAWHAANPERARVYAQNRRARKRAQAGQVSTDIVDQLYLRQAGCCAACSVSLPKIEFELDHIVALKNGGEHADRNLQLLCLPCNRRKGTKDNETFLRLLKEAA